MARAYDKIAMAILCGADGSTRGCTSAARAHGVGIQLVRPLTTNLQSASYVCGRVRTQGTGLCGAKETDTRGGGGGAALLGVRQVAYLSFVGP